MRSATLIAAVSGLALATAQSTTTPVTGALGDAPVVNDNPKGATYVATLPPAKGPTGTVTAVAANNGTGVVFNVNVSGFPSSGGPFLYHIHDAPVPSTGNCTGTLAHLDPFKRGEQPPCDSTNKQTCQVGDLSGKYGKIAADPFTAQYTDLYASTKPGIGAFFGNRSITFHYANATRITCANFTLQASGSNSSTATGTSGSGSGTTITNTTTTTSGAGSAATSAKSSPAPFTGAAATTAVSSLSIVLGGVVAAFFL